jgi:hypothetical protein
MRGLRRADLGSEEIAYRTAQNLYSLHRSVRVTDPPKWVRQLLGKMLAAGVSRYDPDPMAALRRSGGHGGFAPI